MDLSINSLKDLGAFTGAPVEREITWQQGDDQITATVYVRPLSYSSAVGDIIATRSNGDVVASRIASSICDKTGKAVFTPEDVTGEADPDRGPLSRDLTMALLDVIGEVNGLGKPVTKKSTAKKSSGASSSSTESAGAALPKPESD